jgi:hypothetical protein
MVRIPEDTANLSFILRNVPFPSFQSGFVSRWKDHGPSPEMRLNCPELLCQIIFVD